MDDYAGSLAPVENEANSNVQVVVRLRPPEPFDEITDNFSFPDEHKEPHVLSIKDPLSRGRSEHSFMFHKVFRPHDPQDQIFNSVTKPLVDRVMCGYNACCFAYGQTGSGKTHSIFGHAGEHRGLLPRSIEYLFKKLDEKKEYKEIGLVVSFLEVYQDQIRDLASQSQDRESCSSPVDRQDNRGQQRIRTGSGRIRPVSAQIQTRCSEPVLGRRPWSAIERRPSVQSEMFTQDDWSAPDLEVREAPNGQVYVQNLSLIPVKKIEEVMQIINRGLALRETHETKMNLTSSRSHTVFTIHVVQKNKKNEFQVDPETLSAQFNLVDLAGSERLAKSKSEGKRFQEAVLINASLSALGRVVLALASSAKYVPYRDSKLTRILQGGLGGNSFTTLLCCINPSSEHYEESLNSLSFADRCKNVENRPVINYVDPLHNSDKYKIRLLMEEIIELKQQLEACATMQELSFRPDTERSLKELAGLTKEENEEREDIIRKAQEREEVLKTAQVKAEEAEKKAIERQKVFDTARNDMTSKDQTRRLDMRLLREANEKAQNEARKSRTRFDFLMNEQDSQHSNRMMCAKKSAKSLLDRRTKLLLDIPHVLKDRSNIVEQSQKRYEERLEKIQKLHLQQVVALKATHDEQLANMEKQHDFWLKQKEAESQKCRQELKDVTEDTGKEILGYRTEMIAMYELIQMLSRIISHMETGVYPASYKCGIRCVTLPMHTRPKLVNDDFPRLFSTLADTKKKAEKYERLMNKYFPDAPDSTTTEIIAPEYHNDFDPVHFAMEFCRSTEAENEAILHNLSIERLRMLACALKERCRGDFAIQKEKQMIREEVMHELSGHSTVEYLRYLEQEVQRYKSIMAEEVERSNKMKIALAAKSVAYAGVS